MDVKKGQNGLFFALRPKSRGNGEICSPHDLAKIISKRISPSLSKSVNYFSNGSHLLFFLKIVKNTHFGGQNGKRTFAALKPKTK